MFLLKSCLYIDSVIRDLTIHWFSFILNTAKFRKLFKLCATRSPSAGLVEAGLVKMLSVILMLYKLHCRVGYQVQRATDFNIHRKATKHRPFLYPLQHPNVMCHFCSSWSHHHSFPQITARSHTLQANPKDSGTHQQKAAFLSAV